MTTDICRLVRAAAAAMLIAAGTLASAQEFRLLPVDDAATDGTWTRFKARLLDALAKRDQKTVMSLVDARIRNVSGRSGVAEFRRLWEPQSAESALWSELPKLLFLGGAYVKREKGPTELCVPYIYYRWPDNAPAGADAAIIARETLMKAEPSSQAETRQTLSYDLVQALNWEVLDQNPGGTQMWVKIQTKSGTGYVPDEHIRSPLEHRACFLKTSNGWRMTSFEIGE